MKTCFKCGVEKPLSEFYKHKAMADGHLNKCKACAKSDVWHHRNENIDAVRAYDRARGKQPHRIAASARLTAEYRAKYPERYRATTAVSNGLKRGKLQKIPCFYCGSTEVEAHHPDYSRPLDVVWLCAPHHKEIHLAFPEDYYERTNISERSIKRKRVSAS